ncbi:hypothetical protein [uncultured Bilophila sp.]|uniref:hypothetical protein n=1 Tax=uncultured Bilophila sp. TaxID=529385 RepID=UPI00280B53A5|nr:hypothetical protein [uncultured Bilophila sp.]
MVVSSPQHAENTAFFIRFSHWRNPQLKHFAAYPFGALKKKASAIFCDAANAKNAGSFSRRFFVGFSLLRIRSVRKIITCCAGGYYLALSWDMAVSCGCVIENG